MSVKQWEMLTQLWSTTWVGKAICGMHQHLPWILDSEPSPLDHDEMGRLCSQCPVMTRCANYALNANNGHGVDGGFYAGVWLPWGYNGESMRTREMRRRSRLTLKRIVIQEEVSL